MKLLLPTSFLCLAIIAVIYDFKSSAKISSHLITRENPVARIDQNKSNLMSATNMLTRLEREVAAVWSSPDIKELKIVTGPIEVIGLEIDRAEALAKHLLQEPTVRTAAVTISDTATRANIRLKGELADHWSSHRRMSLSIRLREGIAGWDMVKFSIMKLSSRQFPADALHQRLKKSYGLINRSIEPVNVHFNGQDWGLMLAEEQWGEDFFVNHGLPEGPILKFGTDDSRNVDTAFKVHDNVSPALSELGRGIGDELLRGTSVTRLDYEALAFEIALAEAFGSYHVLLHSNMRLYYNPVLRVLVPITSDQDRPIRISETTEHITNYWGVMDEWGLYGSIDMQVLKSELNAARQAVKSTIRTICRDVAAELSQKWTDINTLELWLDDYCQILEFNASIAEDMKVFEDYINQRYKNSTVKLRGNGSLKKRNLVVSKNEAIVIKTDVTLSSLTVDSGGLITLCHECNLRVEGPITLRGTDTRPVIIRRTSGEGEIGTIEVINNGSRSVVQNTSINFSPTTRDVQNTAGLLVTGGEVEVLNLKISNSPYEDAINIKNARIKIKRLLIDGSASDAFDVDFASGHLEGIKITSAGGDGIDISASEISITRSSIDSVKDKGLSVGEKSKVIISRTEISNSSICLAVKDGSETKIMNDLSTTNCENFDFAIFRKKREFGNARITFEDIPNDKRVLLQKESLAKRWEDLLFYMKNSVTVVDQKFIDQQYKDGFMGK